MGELINLQERRADRSRADRDPRPAFYFDLGCPLSYLTSEQIERTIGDVLWIPVPSTLVRGPLSAPEAANLRERAESRARALRLPLVWPDALEDLALCALRAAAFAAECGAGARFTLAAARLAFCGGFDLDDPETLAEAAAAAGIPLRDCLQAAGDTARDEMLQATARGLSSRGITELPAIRVGRTWCSGDAVLPTAGAVLRSSRAGRLAPVG